jgi:hypothetical protein
LPIRFVTACPAFPYPVLPPPKTVSLRSTPPFRFAIALSDSASLHGPPLLRCRGWHGSLEEQPLPPLLYNSPGMDRPLRGKLPACLPVCPSCPVCPCSLSPGGAFLAGIFETGIFSRFKGFLVSGGGVLHLTG